MKTITKSVILITGATDGLGLRVAADLAAQGAPLLLHGRNPDKGRAMIADLHAATGNPDLTYYNADLSSLAEVRRLAADITANHPRLDVLVNNAGLGAGPPPGFRETSADGHELRLAVNYIAVFLLTHLLLPLLRRTADETGHARIVNVASAGQQTIDYTDPQLERSYSGMHAYRQSKLAMVMFTFDLARELAGSNVTVNALHPASLMDTKMVREWFGETWTTVEEGAQALERLILDEELESVSGEYFDGVRQARALDQAYDPEARQRLARLSREWSGL